MNSMGRMSPLLAWFTPAIAIVMLVHAVGYQPSEPIYNGGDESRHVMTGVFFRDFLVDLPLADPRGYATQYYVQYPGLGLLIWPPLFHFVEGATMLMVGTSFGVGRALVALCALAAVYYLFRLVSSTHDHKTAALSVLLFGLAPLTFTYSRQVMLEMPTLAFGMVAIYHYVQYLETHRRRDVFLAAGAAAAAALVRFDAIYLVAFFVIELVRRRSWGTLRRAEPWAAAVLAIVLVSPVYWLIATEVGDLHVRQGRESVVSDTAQFMAFENFFFYPLQLPNQVGWVAFVFAAVGAVASFTPAAWRRNGLYFALVFATYVTFSPLAELANRHAIYWVPGIVVLAAYAVTYLVPFLLGRSAWIVTASAVALSTIAQTLSIGTVRISGLQEAVTHVIDHGNENDVCLFDGRLEGTFVYWMRVQDASRSRWTLRGDKVLYSFLTVPQTDYRDYARTDTDALDIILAYDPSFVIVDELQADETLGTAARLRRVLREHPEQFILEKKCPVLWTRSTVFLGEETFRQYDLLIYRNVQQTRMPRARITFEMLPLGRSIEAAHPRSGQANGIDDS